MKKDTAVANVASDADLAELSGEFPRDPGFAAAMPPRLGMYSQDKTEKVGKTLKLVQSAGTFYTEQPSDEKDAENKTIWVKTELGEEIEGIILFQRKQLRFYDGASFTSSPIYDTDDEVLPLWKDRAEVDRGTPAELQGRKEYMGVNPRSGKPQSKLEEDRILYVLFKNVEGGEDAYTLYQLNLRGSSKWAFLSYVRKTSPNTVVTRFNSVPKENGSIAWNQMTFEVDRVITTEELEEVKHYTKEIKDGISMVKEHFARIQGAAAVDPLAAEFEEDELPALGEGKK